jgi:HEAT repeat protein
MHGFTLLVVLAVGATDPAPHTDVARLRELLHTGAPVVVGQAAWLLLQQPGAEAASIIQQGLQQTHTPNIALALIAGLRLTPADRRFDGELFANLSSPTPALRQAAAEALGTRGDQRTLARLRLLIEAPETERGARQAALTALGLTGRKGALAIVVKQLSASDPALRLAACGALQDVVGLPLGPDPLAWQTWWRQQADLSETQWQSARLAYQVERGRRLAADLERSHAHLVSLHQQLYAKLPGGERVNFLLPLVDHELPAVRQLAVGWATELLAMANAETFPPLADALMRLSRDNDTGVRRLAVLALGRINDPRIYARLPDLLAEGPTPVRAAAAFALTQQALLERPDRAERACQVATRLQGVLDDPALDVVAAAAENLGTLGVPTAGPVLADLLRHPAESVRQTAAQALEHVADANILEPLLAARTDNAGAVRFCVVGALGRVAGLQLTPEQRTHVLAGLTERLKRDRDPSVRSRAAAVLGRCGHATELPILWAQVQARGDAHVQEKAWSAMLEILTRALSLELLREWDRTLAQAGPTANARRLTLVGEVVHRWKSIEAMRRAIAPGLELLVQAQLEQGNWSAAQPVLQELLARSGTEADLERRLRLLVAAAELAAKERQMGGVLRLLQDAQPYLPKKPADESELPASVAELLEAVDKLERQANARKIPAAE